MKNEKLNKVKAHLSNNKKVYITGAVCLVVGAVTGGAYALTRPEVQQVAKQINLLSPNPVQVVVQFVENSTPSKPVHLVGTKKYWDSMSAAARDTGHYVSDISKNVNGLKDHVKGDVFELANVVPAA